jgi:hypothetical protein
LLFDSQEHQRDPRSPTISSIDQTRSAMPTSMAAVTRSV